MKTVTVWDPVVRILHWSLAWAFLSNAFFTDPDGELHRLLGYVVFGLVGVRLVWGLIGTRNARFSTFPPSLPAAARHLRDIAAGRPAPHRSHNPLGALMVYNLLTAILAVSVTGTMLATDTFWAVEWVEETHEMLANWALVSVGLHIGGVLFEQHRTDVNLVQSMITGRKELPCDDEG